MMLVRLISWPYFRRHVLRTMLTVAGIVLGVAVFVGMHTANQSVLFAFTRTVDRIAGRTELQVTSGETGFDEGVLERVQAASAVRVAVPVIEAVVDTGKIDRAGQGNILVLGIDMTGTGACATTTSRAATKPSSTTRSSSSRNQTRSSCPASSRSGIISASAAA
jgi:hypothetical protein